MAHKSTPTYFIAEGTIDEDSIDGEDVTAKGFISSGGGVKRDVELPVDIEDSAMKVPLPFIETGKNASFLLIDTTELQDDMLLV